MTFHPQVSGPGRLRVIQPGVVEPAFGPLALEPVQSLFRTGASETGTVAGGLLGLRGTIAAPTDRSQVDDLPHRHKLPHHNRKNERDMGTTTTLTAADGHRFDAYRAGLPDAPRALVVVQEIFGVNHHIRSVADGFGDAGFAVIAPALFDRARTGVELGYDESGMKTGIELVQRIPLEQTLADLVACADALGHRKVGIVGYCWGGSLAWAAATRTQRFDAAVGWYGGNIPQAADAQPNCPVQLHFGAEDDHIPLSGVDRIRAAHPDMEIYVYQGAGHGFGCSERGSYEARSAALAQERTLSFLQHAL